ncbi:MAG: recombinase family protein [Pyrinomonadaceae bacterium]|nr:recombinase family protein [Pyrinomonadaceae bacterium]
MNAIELIRVSTAGQAAEDRASIPAQRAINQRTAAAYGLTIVRSIELVDVSGAAVLQAPEMQELIRLMANPQIHGVVCREFSRLMRPENFADYALLQVFVDTATILYLPEGPIDFSSKTGRFMGTIRFAVAGMERTEILERIWSAKETKRRAGGFAQGRICLPFGVDYSGGKWSYTGDAERVREAFRLFLAGELSYAIIGRKLSIEPTNLRVILKNPIYTGWRVIDKRRDPSAGAKLFKANGRQGGRRKIQRAEADVIRVKVLEPLISESDFARVQQIIKAKKIGHWRLKESYEHRFTYNGFLTCTCQERIYTKYRRDDYYLCKARCGTHYMRRDVLEPRLDRLFCQQLTDTTFLEGILASARQSAPRVDSEALARQLSRITQKRQRILDTYFEGIINPTERDLRLATIERERQTIADLLAREKQSDALTPSIIADTFAPFVEFDLLNRDQKRRLLNTITPQIIAADYLVRGIYFSGLMGNHKDRDS